MKASENIIEFQRNSDTALVTFCQKRYVTKIKKLAEEHPDKVKIHTYVNGIIVASIPLSAVKINILPPKKFTAAQKKAAVDRMNHARSCKTS